MLSVDQVVNHKVFGKGIIVSLSGKYITVAFGGVKKTFVYPDAFETFLTLDGGNLSDDIVADIANAKKAKQAIIDKKNEENIRAMTKGIVIPGKEGAISEQDEEENRYKNHENEDV